jgi:hypothetical protein
VRVEGLEKEDKELNQEPISLNFVLDVLRLFSLDETDCYGDLFWRCENPDTIEFFVNVNDIFWWATADLEPITPEDLPAMRQAVADVRKITECKHVSDAFVLWAARKRKMRPQRPAYHMWDKQLWALFDACGPERKPEEEG